MNKVIIYYGSKEKFNRIIPKEYRNLTDLVYESDKDGKTMKLVIPNQNGEYPKEEKEEKIFVKNFVISSDEYAGVREHVITNFINFLAKFNVENLYIQNPPLQISEQIIRLYPKAEVKYQKYKQLTTSHLLKINEEYDNKIIGQEDVKLELLQALFPLTLRYRKKPVVLLFYGKSGIGKTETAKYLAKVIGEPIFRKQFSMYQNNQFATYLFGGAHYEKSFAKDLLDRKEKPPALSEKMSQKKDSSKSEVHNSLSSQTQEMQSTSKRGIMDKKSVSKQPQAEKQNPQRPNVNKTQDKQESKDKERQSNGSATKGAAPVHERPATTPVPVKSDTKAAASKQVQNVKERPVTVSKEQPQSSRTKEPVTKPQENIRTQVVRESSPAGKQTSSVVSKHSGTATDGSRQTVQRKLQTKTVQKKNITQSTVKKSTSKKGGKK